MKQYVIGLDFGSLSGRALLLDLQTGDEVGEATVNYAHAVMTDALPDGTPLPAGSAVQHPQDYLDVLTEAIPSVLRQAGIDAAQVVGIGVDFTASTVLPVDRKMRPLCFDPRFSSHPKAYVTMWKDHTAAPQAEKIDAVASERREDLWMHCGRKCSAENGLAKILCMLQTDPEVYEAAFRILEAGDWIVSVLTGTEKRSYNIASLKEFWCPDCGGYPSEAFLEALDPRFRSVVSEKFGGDTVSREPCFGVVTESASALTGLRPGTAVAVPCIDGNMALPACGITDAGRMGLVVGTSLGHLICSPENLEVPGIFSTAVDGLYPGLTFYEAGQSSCGDHLSWFLENGLPASYREEAERKDIGIHALLREKLKDTLPGTSGLLCLDWFNGNRSILSDSKLSGMLVGLTLQTKPEEIYRALLEGTVFGTRRILDRLEECGLGIREIVACGGIARKDGFMMQMFADITDRPIRICASSQAPARAAAMFAAVAAGCYSSIVEASQDLARIQDTAYFPNPEHHRIYDRLYAQYLRLHDFFGAPDSPMHDLWDIRAEAFGREG